MRCEVRGQYLVRIDSRRYKLRFPGRFSPLLGTWLCATCVVALGPTATPVGTRPGVIGCEVQDNSSCECSGTLNGVCRNMGSTIKEFKSKDDFLYSFLLFH